MRRTCRGPECDGTKLSEWKPRGKQAPKSAETDVVLSVCVGGGTYEKFNFGNLRRGFVRDFGQWSQGRIRF